MEIKSPSFPNIDYGYWCQKNAYFADIPLIRSIKAGLSNARKGGLIDAVLKSSDVKTNKDLVDLIESKITEYRSIEIFKDSDLLLIFDLIQGWGGIAGRGPYTKPLGNPTRKALHETISKTYRESMSDCISGDYPSALQKIKTIPYIGESFATKHIYFWSRFGPGKKALPIYDTRIKTLLFLKISSAISYEMYVKSLNKKAEELSMHPTLVESALFSFSLKYFQNGKLTIRRDVTDGVDFDEAKRLQALSTFDAS